MTDRPAEENRIATSEVDYQHRYAAEGQTVDVAVYRNAEEDLLLVEHEYDSATIVTEFAILDDATVRAKKVLTLFPDFVLKAVLAVGYDNIKKPEHI